MSEIAIDRQPSSAVAWSGALATLASQGQAVIDDGLSTDRLSLLLNLLLEFEQALSR